MALEKAGQDPRYRLSTILCSSPMTNSILIAPNITNLNLSSKAVAFFALGLSYQSYDSPSDQPAMNVDSFAAELWTRLEILQKQGENGEPREISGATRHWDWESSPREFEEPFKLYFVPIPRDKWNDEALLLISEETKGLYMASRKCEAIEIEKGRLANKSNLTEMRKKAQARKEQLNTPYPSFPPRKAELDTEAKPAKKEPTTTYTENEVADQSANEEEQSERRPAEDNFESQRKRRRMGKN